MSLSHFNEIIIGQGLAGTALAWSLRWRGRRVLVIDRDAAVTSSRVAAGLMTPVTGRRLVKSWRWDQFWTTANLFYSRVSTEIESRVLYSTRMVRLLASDDECEFLNRKRNVELAGLVTEPVPPVNAEWFDAPRSGFEMIESGRLDVSQYLDQSRRIFIRDGQYLTGDFRPNEDLILTESGVELPRQGLRCDRIVFCQGIDAMSNSWFSSVRFKPAKGEILTVRIEGLDEERIIHRGVWLAPIGCGLFRTGATYDWDHLDCEPTESGREEICARLREFVQLPVDIVRHDAAVRPILRNQMPILGRHPQHPQIGFFNGLGSKGSLQSPWLAEHFAGHLAGEHALDPELDLRRTMRTAQ